MINLLLKCPADINSYYINMQHPFKLGGIQLFIKTDVNEYRTFSMI